MSLFVSGKTYREVADICGISPETVNPLLKAAARNLGCAPSIARKALGEALAVRLPHCGRSVNGGKDLDGGMSGDTS